MPTYTKETALYDTGAIQTGIDGAAQTATNYISIDPTDGIRISDANPATSTTYQRQTSSKTEFVVGGVSRAEISGNGARFGKAYIQGATDNESHLELDYHSLRLIDKEGTKYFEVQDLRDESGYATLTDAFVGDGIETRFTLQYFAAFGTSVLVTVNDIEQSEGTDYELSSSRMVVVFNSAPSGQIVVQYETQSSGTKAFTFGERLMPLVGAQSVVIGTGSDATARGSKAIGNGCLAKGASAIALGNSTQACGVCSHAQNYATTAGHDNQTVIGKYNDNDQDNAFEVGNGTADNARSNAFAVAWDGTTTHGGDVAWTDLSLNSATAAYDSDSTPRYRRWGQTVALIGAVKPKSQVTAGGTLTIGTLPNGCRPPQEIVQVCQGSGGNVWMLRITTAGVVTAERYRSGSTNAAIPTSAWLPFNCTFMV